MVTQSPRQHHGGMTIGLRRDGRPMHISQADNGLGCDCVCPSCRADLVAKQGPVMPWHYAHAVDQGCSETGLSGFRLLVGDMLVNSADQGQMRLPEIRVDGDAAGPIRSARDVVPSRMTRLEESGEVVAWVMEAGETGEGAMILLRTSSRDSEERRSAIAKLSASERLPILEINLVDLVNSFGSWGDAMSHDGSAELDLIRTQLFSVAPRAWVAHPLIHERKAAIAAEAEARRVEALARSQAEEQLRAEQRINEAAHRAELETQKDALANLYADKEPQSWKLGWLRPEQRARLEPIGVARTLDRLMQGHNCFAWPLAKWRLFVMALLPAHNGAEPPVLQKNFDIERDQLSALVDEIRQRGGIEEEFGSEAGLDLARSAIREWLDLVAVTKTVQKAPKRNATPLAETSFIYAMHINLSREVRDVVRTEPRFQAEADVGPAPGVAPAAAGAEEDGPGMR